MLTKDRVAKIESKVKTQDLPSKEDTADGVPNQPFWNMKHFLFLKIYRETLDVDESAKVVGLDAKGLRRALEDPKIRHAMEDAKNDFIESLSLTPTKGAKKFLEVFKKIEARFDEGDSKVAAPMANMAATFLKATGQLGKEEDKVQTKVSININLFADKTPKNVTVNEENIKLINVQ